MDEETYRKQKTALVMRKMELKERLSEVKQQGEEPTEKLLGLVQLQFPPKTGPVGGLVLKW